MIRTLALLLLVLGGCSVPYAAAPLYEPGNPAQRDLTRPADQSPALPNASGELSVEDCVALGTGGGAESRAPMAVAVIGGLTTSTLLTLVVVPVVYTLLDDLVHPSRWFRRKPAAP